MLNENSILQEGNQTIFLNRFVLTEWNKLMRDIMEHMLSDLSEITGLNKYDIMENYINIHDFNAIREILKEGGKWDSEMDRSLVSMVMERKSSY